MRSLALLLALAACDPGPPTAETLSLGDLTLTVASDGRIDVDGPRGPLLSDLRLKIGDGTQDVEFATGSFRFSNETYRQRPVTRTVVLPKGDGATVELFEGSVRLGEAVFSLEEDGHLSLALRARDEHVEDTPRLTVSYDCTDDEKVMGLGAHAFDTEHTGHAFPLWVSEPGIGKSESNDPFAVDFPLEGTRHASSYPVPFLLRPHLPSGLMVDTPARIELDLCASDPGRTDITIWDAAPTLRLIEAPTPVDVVRRFSDINGRMPLPPAWAFAPWVTAVRGEEVVRDAAATLRERRIPTSVIWTEDWKGADLLATGFRLSEEWFADGEFYPDLRGLDRHLESLGFAWLAYFAPFLGRESVTVEDALEANATILDPEGVDPYWFIGVRFTDVTMVDFSTPTGARWAERYMADVRNTGFEGWMTDYAEWLPTDATLASGEDALLVHNDYPLQWQRSNARVLDASQHVWFCRSGWRYTAETCPVVWLGDQRTSFDPDDGMPSLIPMAIGLNLSGIPLVTHDIAGYQSVGNPPSTREVWYRWAALGAYTPIMRTHHGSFKDRNHQWNTDEDTLEVFGRLARDHTALFPYRYGLAARASADGTPILQPTFFVDDTEPVDRMDVWMLGDALLVAPLMEEGATSLQPRLPAGHRWLDVHTGALATGEPVDLPFPPGPDDRLIAVFQREGTVVPRLTQVPDTLRAIAAENSPYTTLADVDGERTLTVFGGGGTFQEADGTTYTVDSAPTSAATAEVRLTSGAVVVGGASIRIDGPFNRRYRIEVVP